MGERAQGPHRELARATADYALDHLFEPLRTRYGDAAELLHYLEALRGDVLDHVEAVVEIPDEAFDLGPEDGERGHPLLRRWLVNLLVDRAGAEGAPVVVEGDPTYDRLFGRIEHRAEMGALSIELHLIRAGSLHRAPS
ncbi:MAG: AAA family ATPase [Alphaproteobacteria bacterium]